MSCLPFQRYTHCRQVGEKRKLTAVEEIMQKEKRQKEAQKAERTQRAQQEETADLDLGDSGEPWLHKGIVVKVVHKKLADGKFYKKKGVVQQVRDEFVGEIKMIETGHVLKLDQEHLETVIPSCGGQVLVVAGKHKGSVGVLIELVEEKFAARCKLEDGSTRALSYEHVCKLS